MVGTTSLALARELDVDELGLLRELAAGVDAGGIVARAGYFCTPGHRPQLSLEQRTFFNAAVAGDPDAPLAPVGLGALTDALRASRIRGILQAFDTLVAGGELIVIRTDVYRAQQLAEIRARLAVAAATGPLTPARFRDAIGTSRKYALPLLEWFDATGVTVRVGDVRTLVNAE
jgi:selenocysteine-specific elongation factor